MINATALVSWATVAVVVVVVAAFTPTTRDGLSDPARAVIVGAFLFAWAAGTASFCAWFSRVLSHEAVRARIISYEPLMLGGVAVIFVLFAVVLRELSFAAFAVFAGFVALGVVSGLWLDVIDRRRQQHSGAWGWFPAPTSLIGVVVLSMLVN